jgi:hypothetical protein
MLPKMSRRRVLMVVGRSRVPAVKGQPEMAMKHTGERLDQPERYQHDQCDWHLPGLQLAPHPAEKNRKASVCLH